MKKFENIKNYLLRNEEELRNIVQEINSYNGSLDNLNFYENDEDFFNTFFADNPMEVARATFYGNYKYCDQYVRFNGYGNLESFDEYEAMKEIKAYIDDIVTCLLECWEELYIDDQLVELLEEEEEEEEEE